MRAVWILALAVAACFPPVSQAAEPERYTLFVELRAPHERARLQKMLKDEGHESYAEREGEITLVLTARELEKVFQAKVRMRTVEKSAFPGMTTQPTLEPSGIPARFEKLIRRIYFDPQRS